MKGKIVLFMVTFCAIIALASGCGKKETVKKEKKPVEQPAVVEQEKEEEPVDPHAGKVQSKLTGLWIKKSVAKKRPIAFMMGNTSEAAPQSGIGKASVVYEIPVEGGITRLMGLIENYKRVKKIGSARSCRYYFVHYAMEYDALYCHFGQSKYAKSLLADARVNNINGLENLAGQAYYRSNERKAPHNAYAVGARLYKFAKNKGYRLNYKKSQDSHFVFAKEEEPNRLKDGVSAKMVKPGYRIDNPVFTYSNKKGLYYRSQYGKPHKDQEMKKQLSCKNIIIQYVSMGLFDDKKSLTMKTVGSGDGMFITNGKAVPITWSKKDTFAVTHYYGIGGKEVALNPGKTWVLIVDRSKRNLVSIK
ncbi:MAG: DUF3048 domain-containing protein [Lachnospiraceae bacterium]|nr:DUF3048 domain-containing protein [Lachnospiraceae bacterium]